jgi:hypothetical protein
VAVGISVRVEVGVGVAVGGWVLVAVESGWFGAGVRVGGDSFCPQAASKINHTRLQAMMSRFDI